MFRVFAFIKYFLYCVNEHSIHSPLVYDLYRNVIKPVKKVEPDHEIEKLRSDLLNSEEVIEVIDFGAGIDRSPTRKISEITSRASSNKYKSILISKLAEFFESEKILELGTSLGLNTLYLSRNVPNSQIITFEGCPNLSTKARQHFNQLNAKNIQLIEGNLDKQLTQYLANSEKFDLAYIDANHRYHPTIAYYEELLRRCHDDSVIIIDDIHYSKEMEQAWNELSGRVEITLSIDLFHFGILKMDPNMRKRHYILGF